MDQLSSKAVSGVTNVTLVGGSDNSPFVGAKFPCCLCRAPLPLKLTKRGKPCCTCNDCGIQTFFRGKLGIGRLERILKSGNLEFGYGAHKTRAVICFTEIEQLRKQKTDLVDKKGFVFKDRDLTNAIQAVDNEIERKQIELAKLSRKARAKGTE